MLENVYVFNWQFNSEPNLLHAYNDFSQAKLPSVLRLYRDAVTADMKTAIKNAVAELLPVLLIRPHDSDFAPGERTMDADGELLLNLDIHLFVQH